MNQFGVKSEVYDLRERDYMPVAACTKYLPKVENVAMTVHSNYVVCTNAL
jgi:hypothetical protein